MGMFDYLKCEYPLPDPHMQDCEFQTKAMSDKFLNVYTITAMGRLVRQVYRWEPVPVEERPFYGTPMADKHPHAGSTRSVPDGVVDMNYHGDIMFYDFGDKYVARFTHGQLEWIRRLSEVIDAPAQVNA